MTMQKFPTRRRRFLQKAGLLAIAPAAFAPQAQAVPPTIAATGAPPKSPANETGNAGGLGTVRGGAPGTGTVTTGGAAGFSRSADKASVSCLLAVSAVQLSAVASRRMSERSATDVSPQPSRRVPTSNAGREPTAGVAPPGKVVAATSAAG